MKTMRDKIKIGIFTICLVSFCWMVIKMIPIGTKYDMYPVYFFPWFIIFPVVMHHLFKRNVMHISLSFAFACHFTTLAFGQIEKQGVLLNILSQCIIFVLFIYFINKIFFLTINYIVENSGFDSYEKQNESWFEEKTGGLISKSKDLILERNKLKDSMDNLYLLGEQELKNMLSEAESKEEYEKAGKIRDVMNKRFGNI